MEHYYQQIKEVYDTFYNTLLKRGQLPCRDTGIGYWGVSVADEVFQLFKKINLQEFDHFVDLGSGDGKVVLIASLFTKASGIEYDPWLVQCSHVLKSKLSHLPHVSHTTFIQKDFMQHDLSQFDLVYWHPDKPMNTGLERKFIRELKGKLIVHGPFNHPYSLNKEHQLEVNGTYFSLYSNSMAENV